MDFNSSSSPIFFKKIVLTVLDELRRISIYDGPQAQRTVLIIYHHLYDILAASCCSGLDKKLLAQIVVVKVITNILGRHTTETCVAGMTALHGAGGDPKAALKRFVFLGLLAYRSNCPEAGNIFDQHERYGDSERHGGYRARRLNLHNISPCPWLSKTKDALFKRLPNPLGNTCTRNATVAQSPVQRPPVSQNTFDRYIAAVLNIVHTPGCTDTNVCDMDGRHSFPRGNYWKVQREGCFEPGGPNELVQNIRSESFTSAQDVEEATTVRA
ncbi:hypothetical protein K439DRAFT_710839 [Ramaria rubella]|nr:hypothetical protein K439DRAFT_710839 [Ramaria rubella]